MAVYRRGYTGAGDAREEGDALMDEEEARKDTARWQKRMEKLLKKLVQLTELECYRPRRS